MQIFLDTADFIEIKDRYETGLISGITTNPTLVRKSGVSYFDFISLLSKEFSFESISAEVNGNTASEMIENAEQYIGIGSEITIKLPLTREGLIACKDLSDQEIKTNVTLCFSVAQAAMASIAGATYISPFIGRLDDIGTKGLDLIKEIVSIYNIFKGEIKTQVLAASIRSPLQVSQVAMMGAHVATIPPKIITQMIKHPLTDIGLTAFMNDWKKTGQKF